MNRHGERSLVRDVIWPIVRMYAQVAFGRIGRSRRQQLAEIRSAQADRLNLIVQTASLRWSPRDDGLRRLLAERGHDPHRCIQARCDQGNDVAVTVIVGDGTIVDLDYREDPQTRQATAIARWDVRQYGDSDIVLARKILLEGDDRFDAEVRAYYEQTIAPNDHPLPPRRRDNPRWHGASAEPDS